MRRLERGEITALEAIDALLAEELTLRENRRVKTALVMARLSTIKTLAGFDFSFQPSLDKNRQWNSMVVPTPTATPLTAATIGLLQRTSAGKKRRAGRLRPPVLSAALRKSARSLPAENAPGTPAISTQRTRSSVFAPSSAAVIASYMASVSAFFLSGRFIRMVRMPSASVVITCSVINSNGPLIEVSDFDTPGKVAALLEELRHASAGCAQLLAEPGVGNLEAPHMAAPEPSICHSPDRSVSLMDIDDSFGIKASFQIIPEQRYAVSRSFLQMIHSRGFEVAVHDLNHDGHLYKTREQFLERAKKINAYGQEFQAEGFRAAVLYMSSTDEFIGQLGNGFSPRTVR